MPNGSRTSSGWARMGMADCSPPLPLSMIATTALMARETALALVLGASVFTDLYYGKVFNAFVAPAMILGLILGGLLGGWSGLGDSVFGLLVGGGMLIVPFAFGIMGGGDVKLAAAVGALAGVMFVLEALAYAFVLAAMLALVARAWQGRAGELFLDAWHVLRGWVPTGGSRKTISLSDCGKAGPGIPFAACLAGGALGAKWFNFFNLIVGT